jgi:hypothetical protein
MADSSDVFSFLILSYSFFSHLLLSTFATNIRNIFVSFDYEKRSSSFISQCGSPYYIYAYIAASSLSALQDEMKSRIYSSISAVFIKYAFVSNRSCRLYVFACWMILKRVK